MNIALIGHGKMGKEIETVAKLRNIGIEQIFTIENNLRGMAITRQSLKNVDVCVDFSTPAAVVHNIEIVAECGKNIVIGTTGWYDKLDDVKKSAKANNIGLLYSPNFSLGMNIFFQIVSSASHLLDKFDAYDVAIQETHHRHKVDSPSGTAMSLAQIVLQNVRRKKEMFHEAVHSGIRNEQLHITSTRMGETVGIHNVMFDSDADSITLTHSAKNRSGYALGALIAAEWLKDKKGVYTMKDVLNSL
jgi:4-hydroxy-tetrahydrodipicolinate reductase